MPLSNYHDIEENLSDIEEGALVRLVCVSYRTRKMSEKAWLEQVYQDYYTFNQRNNIKGFFCKGGNCFFQCLEGVKKSLLTLMAKIFADKQHKSVRVILSEPITCCGFRDWHKHCLNLDNTSFDDAVIASELQQYLPFKPTGWPDWYIEYFVETMKKFDDNNYEYDHGRNYSPKSGKPMSHLLKEATIALKISDQPLLVISVLVAIIIVLMIMLV